MSIMCNIEKIEAGIKYMVIKENERSKKTRKEVQ